MMISCCVPTWCRVASSRRTVLKYACSETVVIPRNHPSRICPSTPKYKIYPTGVPAGSLIYQTMALPTVGSSQMNKCHVRTFRHSVLYFNTAVSSKKTEHQFSLLNSIRRAFLCFNCSTIKPTAMKSMNRHRTPKMATG